MLYLGDLIDQCRRDSNNRNESITPSDTEGIEDRDFIQAINRGQEKLQRLIVAKNDQAFTKVGFLDTVSGQIAYNLFDDIYFENKLMAVEYSPTGIPEDYYQLTQKSVKERNNLSTLYLEGYLLQSGQIILDPKPSTSVVNGLRVTYVKKLPSLDVRRSTVTSVTLDTTNRKISSLIFDIVNSPALTDDNLTALQSSNYFSLCDKYGNIKMARIPYTSINTATGQVVVPNTFTYQVGESISVGDYLVCGYIATTHSQLPDECEQYLQVFCNRYIFMRDSSEDAAQADKELLEIQNEILENMTDLNDDIDYVTVLDDSFLF